MPASARSKIIHIASESPIHIAVIRKIALSEELAQFERAQPVMDDYDLLLAAGKGGIQ